jgi:Kef-type K+ transport system membrane component KefB
MILMALLSDLAGAPFMVGPIMMGLVLPNGPPLGTALVERVELLGSELLMPLYYIVVVGHHMDWITASQQLRLWISLDIILLIMCISKFATVVLVAYYYGMPLKKGLILGLIMNFKGTFEVVIFVQMFGEKVYRYNYFLYLNIKTIIE